MDPQAWSPEPEETSTVSICSEETQSSVTISSTNADEGLAFDFTSSNVRRSVT